MFKTAGQNENNRLVPCNYKCYPFKDANFKNGILGKSNRIVELQSDIIIAHIIKCLYLKKKLQILAKRNCLPKNPLKPQINQVNKLQYILSFTKTIIFLWNFSSLTLIFFWSPDCFHYYIYFPHSTSKSSSDILWVPTPTQKKNCKSLYSFSQVKRSTNQSPTYNFDPFP